MQYAVLRGKFWILDFVMKEVKVIGRRVSGFLERW
jgi:hypothetical protein